MTMAPTMNMKHSTNNEWVYQLGTRHKHKFSISFWLLKHLVNKAWHWVLPWPWMVMLDMMSLCHSGFRLVNHGHDPNNEYETLNKQWIGLQPWHQTQILYKFLTPQASKGASYLLPWPWMVMLDMMPLCHSGFRLVNHGHGSNNEYEDRKSVV